MNTELGDNIERTSASDVNKISSDLLEKLRCPACAEGTVSEFCQDALVCETCKKSFPIIRGIPDLSYFPESTQRSVACNNRQAQYERQIHNHEAQTNSYEERVIRRMGDKTESIATGWAKAFPGPILDFGCGTGQVCRCLRKYHPKLYGFDISLISVEKNVNDNGVLGLVANAFYLPFRDRAVETICCNGTLHHIVDLERAISEMVRVSNKYILISEPAVSSYYPVWVRFKGLLILMLKLLLRFFGLLDIIQRKRGSLMGSKYERPLDPKYVAKLLKEAGFRITMLRFWTNLGWKRRSNLKRLLIQMMVSQRRGTHFEIRAEREGS